MKTLNKLSGLLFSGLILASTSALATPLADSSRVAGSWLGTLKISGIELRLVMHITAGDSGMLSAKLDSPDQGVTGIPVSEVVLAGDSLHLQVAAVAGRYYGELQPDGETITGIWQQPAGAWPLEIKRSDKPIEFNRPQEPKPPFPYIEEEVSYENPEAGISLAGTLTLPTSNGPFPVALLITGSGPQDRNEAIFNHKPFLVIADYLTRRGIAVLRVDDRGVGKSTGNFATATSVDFASDVRAGIAYLKSRKEINRKQIGLIGHSEGGLIAPMVATQSKDVAFIILLAGPGLPGRDILLLQGALIARANGVSDSLIAKSQAMSKVVYDIIAQEPDSATAAEKIRAASEEAWQQFSETERAEYAKLAGDPEQALERNIKQMLSPWFRYFLTYDPRPALQKVKCPVLALNGEMDLQVPPQENLREIGAALRAGGNRDVKTQELPGLNHLFQTSKTGSPSEYGKIEETFSPMALELMAQWIQARTIKK